MHSRWPSKAGQELEPRGSRHNLSSPSSPLLCVLMYIYHLRYHTISYTFGTDTIYDIYYLKYRITINFGPEGRDTILVLPRLRCSCILMYIIYYIICYIITFIHLWCLSKLKHLELIHHTILNTGTWFFWPQSGDAISLVSGADVYVYGIPMYIIYYIITYTYIWRVSIFEYLELKQYTNWNTYTHYMFFIYCIITYSFFSHIFQSWCIWNSFNI